MARKEKRITLTEDGQAFEFVIRQMPLAKLELFALRAVSLLAGSAKDAPDMNGLSDGIEWVRRQSGNALLSCLGNVDTDKAAPLLDELLGCCSRVVGAVETKCDASNIDGYLSDIQSLFTLRKEALTLNFGFFTRAVEKLSASQEEAHG
jgi:hypothetical protein